MKRACFLSLLVLVSIATLLPFVDSATQRGEAAGTASRRGGGGGGGGRAYMSDDAWRAFVKRRALRRRRARLLARARARRQAILAARLQRRQNTMAASSAFKTTAPIVPVVNATRQARSPFMMAASGSAAAGDRAPFAMRAPEGWQRETLSVNGETRFSLRNADGKNTGAAFFARLDRGAVGGAVGAGAARPALRSQIAGTSFTALRRTVIDKMIAERGWVVNDMEREIGGRRVFIVLAQTGDQQAWTYYFTELNGQLYSLAVKSAVHDSATIAAQSAQFIASLRSNDQPAVAAEPQR